MSQTNQNYYMYNFVQCLYNSLEKVTIIGITNTRILLLLRGLAIAGITPARCMLITQCT